MDYEDQIFQEQVMSESRLNVLFNAVTFFENVRTYALPFPHSLLGEAVDYIFDDGFLGEARESRITKMVDRMRVAKSNADIDGIHVGTKPPDNAGFPSDSDWTKSSNRGFFRQKDKDKIWRHFKVDVGGSISFREKEAGYQVSNKMGSKAGLFVLAKVVKIIKTILDRKKGTEDQIKNTYFSSAASGRTKVYRQLVRYFSTGHFLASEHGWLKEPIQLDRKGSPLRDYRLGAKKMSSPRVLPAGTEVTLLTTRDTDIYRIVAGTKFDDANTEYAEFEAQEAMNILKDNDDASFRLRDLGDLQKEDDPIPVSSSDFFGGGEDIGTFNDLPDNALVLAFKKRDNPVAQVYYVYGDPRPGEPDRPMSTSQIKGWQKDAKRAFLTGGPIRHVKKAILSSVLGININTDAELKANASQMPTRIADRISSTTVNPGDPGFLQWLDGEGVTITPRIQKAVSQKIFKKYEWTKKGLKGAITGDLIARRLGSKPPFFTKVSYREITDILADLAPPSGGKDNYIA